MRSHRPGTIILLLLSAATVFAGQAYYSPVTINSGQVPSTQTDFPILISVSDARFKTIANGGHVADAQGDDIRPYTNSSLTTAITGYEKVFYDGTNGILEMWVKRSSVADGLVTYLGYGDTSLTTDGSSSTTWSNSFISVYHLKDGTTLSLTDSLGTHNGTNHSATAAAGKIDGCGSFASASNQYVDLGIDWGQIAITISAWVNGTSFPNAYNGTVALNNGSSQALIDVKSNGKLAVYVTATTPKSYDGTGSHTLSTGTWYYLTATYDTSTGLIGYVDAASDGTATANGHWNISSLVGFSIGQDAGAAGRFWNGPIDEVRIANVVRTANWITTEYNNQSAPGTFETLGTEAVPVTRTGWFMFFPN